uniref:Putative methyl-CpG-binding domain-containing protein 9 isoform X2 n=1 Tax=Davidia involucrata TaxID=16924 RepID=A0A5B6YUQ3_DAVIN
MMEVTGSAHDKPEPTRSALGIDLNEIPSSSSPESLSPDAFAVVQAYQDQPTPPAGDPAEVPGDSFGSVCGACGLPEVRGHVVVCDGCESGFHIGCAGMQGRQVLMLDEWMCGKCVSNGVPSNRWPLGSKWMVASGQKHAGVRLLDIGALPPCDGESEAGEELLDSRKQTPGDNSFGGNPFGAPVTFSNLYAGNGLGFQKASGIVTHTVKSSFEDILHHTKSAGRNFEEVDMHSLLGRFRSSNHTAIRLPPQNPSERHMQALRDFIAERHCVLEEGWHVEFKTLMGSDELHTFYCAPDGKAFESIPEVACYLGLMSNSNSIEPEGSGNGSASLQRRMHLPKRQKSARLLIANGVAESNETLMSGSCEDLSSDFHTKSCASKLGNNVKVMEARPEENSGTGPQQLNDGLPVQYEDFFVLSLGKVDTRSSYHNVNQIWPVGYKSCWHDRITGSLFMCDVSDGGDSGPVFKVRRYSCSTFPIPNASTVLFRPNLGQSDCQNKEENDEMISVSMDYDEDCSVQMILSDPSPPAEHDILSCLGSYSDESSNVQMSNCLQLKASPPCESSGNLFSDNSVLRDEIGEFSVEEYSSSSAWRTVSKKLMDTCREIYMQRGSLKFFCKHVENDTCSPYSDITEEKNKEKFTSLAKFCGSLRSVKIPSVIQGDSELGTVFEVLVKWLDQDRFGLDVAFVQEIVERLPDVLACSQYIFLNERSHYSSSLTVANGLLLVKTKGGVQAMDEEALNGLFRGCKSDRKHMFEDPVMERHRPPPGKPISSRLPPQLVGDVLQVWEFMWRFHEILGLEEPLSFEELEEELISPWSDGLNLLDKFGGEFHKSQSITSHGTDGTSRHIFSSCSESGPAVSMENPHAFIQMETGAMKEAAQARMASITYSRCTGFTLNKVHNSLLKVLISELQSKVAAVVDPTFDTGESKSKRGKRKDADCLIAAKRTKLSMLPINELTWPELARRYILAVLSTDGNLDSAEITIRGSGKVFRCLQGDGGVLCGSLTGVAGMEADALLLAEATKKIFGSLNREKNILTIDDGGPDATSACDRTMVNDGNIPEWAQLLEPVRKLPTNVGARIKRCIYDALEKGPPEWAKKDIGAFNQQGSL